MAEFKEDKGVFERPQGELYYFSQETTPLEFVQNIRNAKTDALFVEIPPDHPTLGSEVALRWLALQFEKLGKDILIDQEEGELAALLRDCGFEIMQDRMRPKKTLPKAITPPSRKGPAGLAEDSADSRGGKKENYFNGIAKKKKDVAHEFFSHAEEENSDDMYRRTFTTPPRRNKPRIPWYVWFVLTIALAAVFLFTAVLPRAEVVIIPETSEVKQVKSASIQASWQDAQKDAKHLRGKIVEAESSVESTTPVTELSQTGEMAKGEVTITNQTGQEVNLPAGSLLTSDNGIEYALANSAVVPPATVLKDNTIKFGTIRASVQAKERGAKPNRDAGRLALQAVPAHRRDRIYAEITAAIAGGQDAQGKMVREEHVAAARDLLSRELRDALAKALAERVPQEWFTDTSLEMATVTQEIVLPPVGSVSDDFSLRLVGTLRTLSASRADTERLFGAKPEACRDRDNPGKDLCAFQIAKVRSFDAQQGKAEADISLTRIDYPDFNHDEMKKRIQGMSFADARRELLATKGVKDARITVRFSMKNFIPKDLAHINVRVEK